MRSSIFGPPGIYSVLYSTSECTALFSAFQVYIQHYIQHPNVELYIQTSRSISSAIFKKPNEELYIRPSRSIFSARFKKPNVELYIRPTRYIFSTIFNIRIKSSRFGTPGLYSALYSKSECRDLYSALQVYIQRYIKKPNLELYIQHSRSMFSARFKKTQIDPTGLYSALHSTSERRALYSALEVYIQHYIQHPNVELYIRLSMSIFSTIFNIRMQSSI